MKLLNAIDSIFNTHQRNLLEKYLYKKIGAGNIKWKDIFTEQLKKRLPNLVDGIKLNRIPGSSSINDRKLAEQMEDIELTLISLTAQSEELNNILNRHEMFRKDNVKSYTNVAQAYIDMVNNEVKDYKTNNITVKDGIVELLPSTIVDFEIKTIDIEYFPENYIDRSGNDPTEDNIYSGTNKDYWLSEIITSRRCKCGAIITLGFNGSINFNILQLSAAGKYSARISKAEVKSGSSFVKVNFKGNTVGKNLQLTILDEDGNPVSYVTEYIRLTITQDKPDFLWEKYIDNEKEILSYESEQEKIVTDYIYKDKFELVHSEIVRNVYSYIFGLYYIRVMLKTYDGDTVGNFYSRKYSIDRTFRFINIKTEEYKPSPFTIEYKVIQHDGAYANYNSPTGNIEPYVDIELTNTYSGTEIISGVTGNTIILKHYPIFSTSLDNFDCSINGKQVRLIKEFDEKNDNQVIMIGKVLYFNKSLSSGDTIKIYYKHYTDYVIVQAILKTNTVYQNPDTPKILKFDVKLSSTTHD